MIGLSGRESIVDAGCGFGELYLYMQENGIEVRRYTGLEIMEPMVEAARERVDCEIRLCDVLTDSLPRADYYVCSGAMNILTRDETERFIRRCLAASNRGFVFNLLEGEDESMVYNYYRPSEIEALAHDLGVGFTMKRGYLPKDFTVYLEKTDAREEC